MKFLFNNTDDKRMKIVDITFFCLLIISEVKFYVFTLCNVVTNMLIYLGYFNQ